MGITMILELYYLGGGKIEQELDYLGTLEEIAAESDKDNNELLYYMRTHDDKGEKSFCFRGFMFKKDGLVAARLYEPEFAPVRI
jgi:hypothetical protein